MKYYAVTNDPNELLHYGVKGMKWGQHLFGRQKSAAYRRASSKLSKSMRSGIKSKIAHWKKSPSPAVLRAKAQAKAAKAEAKAFRKEQKFMNKAVQKAREGRLKYGKLTDDQVRRVTERLALEQRARQLGGQEKPKFARRVGEAIGAGILGGTTAYITERGKARGKFAGLRKYAERTARVEARAAGVKQARTKIESKKEQDRETKREAREKQIKNAGKSAAKAVGRGAVKGAKAAGRGAAKVWRARRTRSRRTKYPRIGPYAYELGGSEYSIR